MRRMGWAAAAAATVAVGIGGARVMGADDQDDAKPCSEATVRGDSGIQIQGTKPIVVNLSPPRSGGVALTVGCGGGSRSPSSPTPTPTSSGDVAGVVADNHPEPHVAVITAVQLGAGAALTLDISNSRHSHTVTLSGAEVTRIAARSRVSVMSSINPHSDGSEPHSHMVTFN